eukprot:SAG11_NODE_411_length_9696_cov_46.841513_10_plen_282_part_00
MSLCLNGRITPGILHFELAPKLTHSTMVWSPTEGELCPELLSAAPESHTAGDADPALSPKTPRAELPLEPKTPTDGRTGVTRRMSQTSLGMPFLRSVHVSSSSCSSDICCRTNASAEHTRTEKGDHFSPESPGNGTNLSERIEGGGGGGGDDDYLGEGSALDGQRPAPTAVSTVVSAYAASSKPTAGDGGSGRAAYVAPQKKKKKKKKTGMMCCAANRNTAPVTSPVSAPKSILQFPAPESSTPKAELPIAEDDAEIAAATLKEDLAALQPDHHEEDDLDR